MTNNTELWDALGKTDPNHTQSFNRAGGFRGTSVNPMWVYKRLTEQFGAAGIGWGVNQPSFETVHSQEGEVLVYCTISCWHGSKDNLIWGVGGDKAVSMRSGKPFHDDEAFKKATTDAIMNAFKSIGVAADIYMGRFDDDKYVADLEREFAPKPVTITEEQRTLLMALLDATGTPVAAILEQSSERAGRKINDLREMPADQFTSLNNYLQSLPAKKEAA